MPDSQAPTRIVSGDEDHASQTGDGSSWSDPPPRDEERDPLLGTTLNQTYTLVKQLGSGGMGRVYEATHSRIKNKRFAIKVLHPELAFSGEVRSRFAREAEAAACVSHPNAVSVFDVALTPEGWPYLVCEFLEGRELAALLKSHGRLPTSTAIDIAIQVSLALSEAHECGVVHRDLKPHNVFLVGDFEHGLPERVLVKVLDFGLSRFLEGGSTELTKTGAILGTPSYMAPEQARGERADHRTDVYGLGAILYACVTGRSPFRGETPQAVLLAVMSQEPPRPSSLNPFIGPELELVIQRAMARDPAERYPDMKSLREALERLHVPAGQDDAPARRRLPSVAGALEEEPGSARFDLALTLLLALCATTGAFVAAVSGIVVLAFGRWPLSPLETLLATLVVVGTLLTPGLLVLLRLRARIWGNTARVLELLGTTRRSLVAGLLTYGTLALLLLFWDWGGVHALGRVLPIGGGTLSWPGLPATLFVAALFVVSAEVFHARLVAQGGWTTKIASESVVRRRRWLAGPGVFGAGVVLATTTVAAALSSRAPESLTSGPELVATEPVRPEPPGEDEALKEEPTSAPEPAAPTATTTASGTPAAEPASADELRQAMAGGTEALAELSRRYPADPKVARALGVQYAASASTLMQSLETFARLFALDETAALDKEVRQLVLQMTEIGGAVSRRAFKLLASEMGHEGPDQLYRLALLDSKSKDEARRALDQAKTAGTVSEALSIAMDLQWNDSCEERVPLLPRAIDHGDQRSVQILGALSVSRRGCGKRKRELCKPVCPAQAEQFRAALDAIAERLATP